MAKKEVLEIRITFREDQKELYDYIKRHNSASGFLKDIAYREMLRDDNYVNGKFEKSENQNVPNMNMYHNPYFQGMYSPPIYPVDTNQDFKQSQNQQNQQKQQNDEKEKKSRKSVKVDINMLKDLQKKSTKK